LQAAFGRFTHLRGSDQEQAIDIQMPEGTTVTAARGGTVVAVRSDCSVGGMDLQYMADVNYVVIKHSDGTYGEYLHLQKNGALVHVGDTVTTGQAIALSGNTGYTSEPHVHFMVFYNLSGTVRKSVPIYFNSPLGQIRLQEGYTYRGAQ
jgi:murein DD-endopeptidase MepM/ murein hydrolase activator NlpD